ncbi:MAG TPA: PaaX family transcriptional regulator C-terminal domain-containing protein [Acetobacteraceae bacterium]|nr:PaaX family transcriptional regulator C-terminal domain-containing protein [Acetobacteraceae bacterium]
MLDAILARLRDQPSRTGSLIITLYGDAIAPRGGALWLGTLLTLFRAMDVGDGVVRTAVSRLAAANWLARRRVGRNSFYRLAQHGLRETEAAAPRIYGTLTPPWGGRFRIALVEPGEGREAVRALLTGAGYGAAGGGVMVGCGHDPAPQAPGLLLLDAETDSDTARRLALRAWPLDDLAARYRRFLDTFPEAPVPDAPLEALIARMVLIHEWRRVALRDPHLPRAILPEDWPGLPARARAAALYAALAENSERWLTENAIAEDGPLPPPASTLRRRFAD